MLLNFKMAIDNNEKTHFSTIKNVRSTDVVRPSCVSHTNLLNKIICFNPLHSVRSAAPPSNAKYFHHSDALHPHLVGLCDGVHTTTHHLHGIASSFVSFIFFIVVTKCIHTYICICCYSLASHSVRSFPSFCFVMHKIYYAPEYKLRLISLQC